MKKIIFALFSVFILSSTFALAHERQVINIEGKDYLFVIGSLDEPVVEGDRTGLDLRVLTPDPKDIGNSSSPNAKPVIGLEKTLKIEKSLGESKKEFPLKAAWGKPGNYETLFYPTLPGVISYRVFGTIEDKNVDLMFTCSKEGHVMTEMDHRSMDTEMKNGDYTIKFHSGSFGCIEEKEGHMFPVSQHSDLKDVFTPRFLGILSLIFVLGILVQIRRTRK